MKTLYKILIGTGLLALPLFAHAAVLPVLGGTGTSCIPTYGQVLVGTSGGVYGCVATSTLGISGGSGSSPWSKTLNNIYDTTYTNPDHVAIGTNLGTSKLTIDSSAFHTLTGTFRSNGDNSYTGTGTIFLSELAPGDVLYDVTDGAYINIISVTDNSTFIGNTDTGAVDASGTFLQSPLNIVGYDPSTGITESRFNVNQTGSLNMVDVNSDGLVGANGIVIDNSNTFGLGAGISMSTYLQPKTGGGTLSTGWQFFAKAQDNGDFTIGRANIRDNMLLGNNQASVFFPGPNTGSALAAGTYSLGASAGSDPTYTAAQFWGANGQTANILQILDYLGNFLSGFDASGNLGIGTTTPWRALSVKGSSDLGNNALAGSFTATTTKASTFPNASTTQLTVSNQLYDSKSSSGTSGNVLMSTNVGTNWVSTTTAYASLPITTSYNGTTTVTLLSNTQAQNVTGKTAAFSFNTFQPTATTTYQINGYAVVNSVTLDVIQPQCVFTDETSTSRTITFTVMGTAGSIVSGGISATGYYSVVPSILRVKANTSVVCSVALTTGTGSISYDTGIDVVALEPTK